jgi:preprotein translocase SecE subunit
MSKKKKNFIKADNNLSNDVKAEETAAENVAEKETEQDKKPVKIVKAKKAVKKPKKPNIFIRMWKKIREIFSELKKVTWPTFPTVLKQTGVVIAVVFFFLILIFAFDFVLSLLYTQLLK